MKRFWQGFGAALVLVAVAVFVVIPMYCGYTSRVETADMLIDVQELKRKISDYAAQAGGLAGVGRGVPVSLPQDATALREVVLAPEGTLVVKGGRRGQVVVLIPSLSEGQINWRCIGGRDEDVPAGCRRRLGK